MSTRALYTFIGADGEQDWNVYKHSDGYPSGAADTLATAQAWFAWKAPRYESDEFAAAFIAAGKAWALVDAKGLQPKKRWESYAPKGKYNAIGGGGVRLMPQGNPTEVAKTNCCDIEYRYEIRPENGKLRIIAFAGSWRGDDDDREEVIINCLLIDFPSVAANYEKAKKEEEATAA